MPNWNKGIAKITIPTPFSVGDVHLYLVKGDRLTLIDAGVKTEQAWKAFQHELKQLNLTVNDIDQVILTHHHPDHIGLLDFLPPEIEVYGHQINERWLQITDDFIQLYDDFFMQMYRECSIPDEFLQKVKQLRSSLPFFASRSLTGVLQDGDTLPGMNDWRVVETPGHAQSHLIFHNKNDEIVIGGDHLLANISSNPLLEPPLTVCEERPKPQIQYNSSLRRLLTMPIEKIYPGHGPEVTNINKLVDERLKRQHVRALKVKEMIESEPLTTFEICKQLFPKAYMKEFSLTISETVAQLDYLQSLNLIHSIEDEKGSLKFLSS